MRFCAPFYSHRDHFILHRIIRAANVPAFVQMTVSFGWTANGNRILYFSTLKITIFALVTSLDVCWERYNECAKLSMVHAKCENEHLWFFFLLSFYLGLKETKQKNGIFLHIFLALILPCCWSRFMKMHLQHYISVLKRSLSSHFGYVRNIYDLVCANVANGKENTRKKCIYVSDKWKWHRKKATTQWHRTK